MTGWILAVVLAPLCVAEITEVSPWLAQKCIGMAARCLPTAHARERFAEEWSADLARVPGKFTKLAYSIIVLVFSAPTMRALDWHGEREVSGMLAARDRATAELDGVNSAIDLADLIADSIASVFGFRGVVVSFETSGNNFRSVAVHGSQPLRDAMLGSTCARFAVERVMRTSRSFGTLRFIDETTDESGWATYIPPPRRNQEPAPGNWTPDDGLLAPLYAQDGLLLGLISVDEPVTGQFPGPEQLSMIEAYTAAAASRLAALRGAEPLPIQISSHREPGADNNAQLQGA